MRQLCLLKLRILLLLLVLEAVVGKSVMLIGGSLADGNDEIYGKFVELAVSISINLQDCI